MAFRAYADNVVVKFIPEANETASGIRLPDRTFKRSEARRAVVVASGPGHHRPRRVGGPGGATVPGVFVPNETKPGDVVLVDAFAGQDFAFDLNIPRHNKDASFEAIGDERGEFRIVREDEIHGVVEP